MASDSSWNKDFAAGEIGAEVGGGPGRFAHILLFAIVSFSSFSSFGLGSGPIKGIPKAGLA